MQVPRIKIPQVQPQTALKHILIHTGIYYVLTGRRTTGARATKQEVWMWLTRVFRVDHPDHYETLLQRQEQRIHWEDSGGKYTADDQGVLDRAFITLYSNTIYQQSLFSESEIDAILQGLGLENIQSLLKKPLERYIKENKFPEDVLKGIFVFLAELDDDTFDTTILIFTEKGRIQYAQSFARYSVSSLGALYTKFGEVSLEAIRGTANLGKGTAGYIGDFMYDLYTYTKSDVQTATRATKKRIPSKRSVVQKSQSTRRSLFGKHAHNV